MADSFVIQSRPAQSAASAYPTSATPPAVSSRPVDASGNVWQYKGSNASALNQSELKRLDTFNSTQGPASAAVNDSAPIQGAPPTWMSPAQQGRWGQMSPDQRSQANDSQKALTEARENQLNQIGQSVLQFSGEAYAPYVTQIQGTSARIRTLMAEGASNEKIQAEFTNLNNQLAGLQQKASDEAKTKEEEKQANEFKQQMDAMKQQMENQEKRHQEMVNLLIQVLASKDDDGDKKKGVGGLFAALTPPILTGNA